MTNTGVESAVAIADGLRDRVTLTHAGNSDSSRMVVVALGTALTPGDIVLVGERWF